MPCGRERLLRGGAGEQEGGGSGGTKYSSFRNAKSTRATQPSGVFRAFHSNQLLATIRLGHGQKRKRINKRLEERGVGAARESLFVNSRVETLLEVYVCGVGGERTKEKRWSGGVVQGTTWEEP